MRAILLILVLIGIILAACGGDRGGEQQTSGDTGDGMAGMDSMNMSGRTGMEGMGMMPAMRAHMDSMMRLSPEQMSGAVAMHDRMMSQMMDRMGAEMRGMSMRGDTAWTALTDSVKRDLAELPELRGTDLSARMEAHAGRVQRLLGMHESMTKGM